MNKPVRMALILAVVWLLAVPNLGVAADLDWQINWQQDGSLQEEVRIEQGVNIITTDPDWQFSQEGDIQVLMRQIQDWAAYKNLQDSLPLEMQIRNFLIWQQAVLEVNPTAGTGLWSTIADADTLHLTINTPGIIISSSAQQKGESWSTWDFSDSAALLQAGNMARIIKVDGLLLGITIFIIGILWIGIRFNKQLKKVEQIIVEEYAVQPDQSESPPSAEQD